MREHDYRTTSLRARIAVVTISVNTSDRSSKTRVCIEGNRQINPVKTVDCSLQEDNDEICCEPFVLSDSGQSSTALSHSALLPVRRLDDDWYGTEGGGLHDVRDTNIARLIPTD